MAKQIVLDDAQGRVISAFYKQMIQWARIRMLAEYGQRLEGIGFVQAYDKDFVWAKPKLPAYPEITLEDWHVERIIPLPKTDTCPDCITGVRTVEHVLVIRCSPIKTWRCQIKSTFQYKLGNITDEGHSYVKVPNNVMFPEEAESDE